MTVSFRAVGTWENGSTGLTADEVVAVPAAQATGDLMILLASWKNFAITATVAGWTKITEFADGTVGTGNGVGSMKVGAWYKVATSDTEADPTLDFSTTTGLVGEAVIIVFSKSLDEWVTPEFVTAAWPLQDTGDATSSSTIILPASAAVVALIGIRDDSATFTRDALTGISSTGSVSWNGVYVEAPATHASTTTGNDMSCDAGYYLTNNGSFGVAVSLTVNATIAANETGAVLWLVLADQAAAAPRVPRFTPYPQLLAH